MSQRRPSLRPESSLSQSAPHSQRPDAVQVTAGETRPRSGFARVRWALMTAAVRGGAVGSACVACVCISGAFSHEAHAAALPGHLHAAMLPGSSQPSRSVEIWTDGAVLVNSEGELGVRAWASHPGSCMGPAGPAAARAARAAAEELIRLASVKRATELEVEGVMELDQRTRRGVECTVEITVSRLERQAAVDAPKRSRRAVVDAPERSFRAAVGIPKRACGSSLPAAVPGSK